MRADFVGHATLLVRHGQLSILTDPWWTGPAYHGQWFPYPLPVPERYDLRRVDAVYISHAHEDHLHRGTLKQLLEQAPDAEAIIPERYDTHMREYLHRIGFRRIREVASGTSVTLRKGTDQARLTLVTHMDDSMLALEAGGEVLLNANDALHASSRELIEVYCRYLKRRLPRIDYLFCGFGGASYFPNCFRVPGKDDAAVAIARERFFLDNVALVADRLRPHYLIPFAAHFVLMDERMWWISERRLSMAPPAETLRSLTAAPIKFHDLQPGDYVQDGQVHASPYPSFNREAVRATVAARYAVQPATDAELSTDQFNTLVDEVRTTVMRKQTSGTRLDAAITLWDYPGSSIRISIENGAPGVTVAAPDEPVEVRLETRSALLTRTMGSPFGRDLITIGYGALVHLRSHAVAASNAHDRLLDLLAPRRPRWRELFRAHPLRTLGFALGDASMRHDASQRLRQRLGIQMPPKAVSEPALYAIGDWASLATVPE
jgi:hypothetical protein